MLGFKNKRQFLKTLLVLAVVCQVSGCGLFGDDYKLTQTRYLTYGGGVTADSTVLFLMYVYDHFEDDWMDKYETREYSLNLADIRKEKIYWKKDIIPRREFHDYVVYLNAIDSDLSLFKEYSWGEQYINQIAILRLDEKLQQSKQVEIKYKEIKLKGEGWKSTTHVSVRPWQNGLILANSRYWDGIGSGNHYALLDTTAGTMERWEPAGEFEWLKYCLDAKWSSVGGLCLKEMQDTLGFVLLRNGVDTLAVRYDKPPMDENRQQPLGFYGISIVSNGWVYLINGQEQVSNKPLDFWALGTGTYYDLSSDVTAAYGKTILY